jgi:hypothetical protein
VGARLCLLSLVQHERPGEPVATGGGLPF